MTDELDLLRERGRVISENPQGSDEWLNDRAGVVTTSMFNAVMAGGEGKTRTAYMLKLANERLTGRCISDGFKSKYMERGNEIEDQGRATYEIRTGNTTRQVGLIYLDDQRRVGASVDSLVTVPKLRAYERKYGNHEIKCPAIHTHSEYLLGCLAQGNLPPVYVKQVQGQMWVTDRAWCDFSTFHPEAHVPLKTIRVHRDEKVISEIQTAVSQFLVELDRLTEQLEKAA